MESPQSGIEDAVAGAVREEGYEVLEIVLDRGGRLRVTIDREGGVGLEDCARAHRRARETLEGRGLDAGDFRLEVESPGADRRLRTQADFEWFRGRRVRVVLREERDGRRRFVGELLGASGKGIRVACDGLGPTEFSRGEIASVRLHV